MKGSWRKPSAKACDFKSSAKEGAEEGEGDKTGDDYSIRGGWKAAGRGRNYWDNRKKAEDAETVWKQVKKKLKQIKTKETGEKYTTTAH